MRLSEVLLPLNKQLDITIHEDPIITGISNDSRKVQDGNIFVAISGYQSDGHDFIQDAIYKGAIAVIGEKPLKLEPLSVPFFQVSDTRKALGIVSSKFYGNPSVNRKVIGVTGTNGKTTVSYMLKHILETSGRTCSLIGTVSYMINGEEYEPTNTTPDALQLQKLLAESDDDYIVIEISSHAVTQSRIEGLQLDYGVFTNLSHDHLDYHHSMEQYFSEKKRMFTYLKQNGKAVINTLNSWGDILAKNLFEKGVSVRTLGNNQKNDLMLEDVLLNEKTECYMKIKDDHYCLSINQPGMHNVYNAALAFLIALDIGVNTNEIIKALESFPGVPGRFEVIRHPSGARFIIDYAHTQDAIEYCLDAAKQQNAKRIVHIFGFRGNRDPSKREKMIMTSVKKSDQLILTLDDLNGTSEKEMISELMRLNRSVGIGKGKVISDRTLAIQEAWKQAKEGDYVLITGKGPERYERKFALPAESDIETICYLQTLMEPNNQFHHQRYVYRTSTL